MSPLAQFLLLAAIEVAGLFVIWFLIRARVRSYLELENLLSGVREEARALVLELNETADRNVSLVEDRMASLRELLAEADRRILVGKRELATREIERDVYAKLSRRRPITPEPGASPEAELSPAPAAAEEPVILSLGQADGRGEAPRRAPEVVVPEALALPGKTKREEALELYRGGFSADLIAARMGATVAEIELLVEIEERRAAARGKGL